MGRGLVSLAKLPNSGEGFPSKKKRDLLINLKKGVKNSEKSRKRNGGGGKTGKGKRRTKPSFLAEEKRKKNGALGQESGRTK